jgi:hypothetical protein
LHFTLFAESPAIGLKEKLICLTADTNTMKHLLSLIFLFAGLSAGAQLSLRGGSLGVASGFMNYSGDLKPNSFTFRQSNPFIALYYHQPLTGRIALRAGFGQGSLESSDKFNRGYLVPRNLDFKTNLSEGYAGLELALLDLSKVRVTPYMFLGAAVFHFNPWTTDASGNKVYLQPLSTEGQGLDAYPARKVYALTQRALCFAGGLRWAVNDNIAVGIEFTQRKTFTDYIDDVSSNYVDREKLLSARGPKAVELAFRGDELANSNQHYPSAGEQRGTPTENDWYYFFGAHVQVKLSAIKYKVTHAFVKPSEYYMKRCPTVF